MAPHVLLSIVFGQNDNNIAKIFHSFCIIWKNMVILILFIFIHI